jgi:exodeoxyribonuclease VII small subunit
MSEETYTFDQARARLEDIVSQVRKKDTALEASLDLLEEGVRLANLCTEQIDHTQWREATGEEDAQTAEDGPDAATAVVEAVEETTDAAGEDAAGEDAGEDTGPDDSAPDGSTEDAPGPHEASDHAADGT